VNAAVEEIRVSDERLRAVWGDGLERLVLTTKGTALRGSYRLALHDAQGS